MIKIKAKTNELGKNNHYQHHKSIQFWFLKVNNKIDKCFNHV